MSIASTSSAQVNADSNANTRRTRRSSFANALSTTRLFTSVAETEETSSNFMLSSSERSSTATSRIRNRYHKAASKHNEERKRNGFFKYLKLPKRPSLSSGSSHGSSSERQLLLTMAKEQLLRSLNESDGDTTAPDFTKACNELSKFYDASKMDVCAKSSSAGSSRLKLKPKSSTNTTAPQLEGSWVTLSKPKYKGCVGKNRNHDYTYTLSQMTFDMFSPSDLICSIQGSFNPIRTISTQEAQDVKHVPESLRQEFHNGNTTSRSYDIITAFSIEPYNLSMGTMSSNMEVDKRLEGILTTCGYVIPNPEKPNRLSVWFTGGAIEVNCTSRQFERIFGKKNATNSSSSSTKKTEKKPMGAVTYECKNEKGKMYYHFTEPFGGHDIAYIDVLYLDETLRIVRTSSGSVCVFARMIEEEDN